MNLENLFILGLGIWRISSLFVQEDGPFDVFLGIREKIGIAPGSPSAVPDTFLGGLFSCVWCMSAWVSGAVLIAYHYIPLAFVFPAIAWYFMLWLALSAIAIIANSIATA